MVLIGKLVVCWKWTKAKAGFQRPKSPWRIWSYLLFQKSKVQSQTYQSDLLAKWSASGSPGNSGIMPTCLFNHVNEFFGDWMASEILPIYVKEHFGDLTTSQKTNGFANISGVQCEPGNDGASSNWSHPGTKIRTVGLLGANPKSRREMQCESTPRHIYCDGVNEIADSSFNTPAAVKPSRTAKEPTER